MNLDTRNNTLIVVCSEVVIPEEFFYISIFLTVFSFFLIVALFIFVGVEGRRAKAWLSSAERTWITALDFIGGMPGVDSVFEPYEEFFGKSQEELEKLRRENKENRRYSTPYISLPSEEERAMMERLHQRSRSNFEHVRTCRSSLEEEADFYLKVLNHPQLYYQNLPSAAPTRKDSLVMGAVRRRLSLSSGSGDSGSVESVSMTPPIISASSRSSLTPPTPSNKRVNRVNFALRSSSIDDGFLKRPALPLRKKPSVIHEENI